MIVLRVKALQTIAVLCLIGAFIMVILYCVNSSHNQSGLLRHRNFKPSAKFLKALNVRKKNHEKRSKFLNHVKAAMNKKKRKKKRIKNETKGGEANMVRRKAKVQLNHHDLKLQTELIKAFALKDNDARHPFANMHQFNYTLSPSQCHKKPVFLLTIVHSKPHDFRQRLTFRKTFGQIQSSWKKRIVYVFSMGLVSDPKLQQLIQKEAATFNDIIQGGFDDLEENLALKHIMGLHWKKKYCRHAKFILKIDDDVFIHPFGIIKNILGKSKRKHFMSCREGSGKAVIEKMKNRKLRATYPVDFLPSFCNGYAIVMSSDVASGILAASEKIRYVPLEGLFITGVLRLVSGIGLSSTEVIHGNCHPRLFTGKEIVKITALHLAGKCKNKMSKLWKRYHKVFKGKRKLKV
ncbi:beta-1,3-galactosyltransferase 1-like [Haliotis rufescens]|uniref:beta-1,3-galactosyltransferase 1-like n=1 Tax=Haliotis rufescens TaxID=6454 RepID=UPI001EB09664|nr:beta-1,3-galactosyltransferase 1-like [Haliotis rufescens]